MVAKGKGEGSESFGCDLGLLGLGSCENGGGVAKLERGEGGASRGGSANKLHPSNPLGIWKRGFGGWQKIASASLRKLKAQNKMLKKKAPGGEKKRMRAEGWGRRSRQIQQTTRDRLLNDLSKPETRKNLGGLEKKKSSRSKLEQ